MDLIKVRLKMKAVLPCFHSEKSRDKMTIKEIK